MMLTAEQRDQLLRDGRVSMIIDGVECVVLRADLFDRMQPALRPPEPAVKDRWEPEGDGIDVDDYVS